MDEQKPDETPWTYNPSGALGENMEDSFNQSRGVPLPAIPEISWSASEYVSHEKNISWYVVLFVGALFSVISIFIITREFLVSFVVLLTCLAIGMYAARKPEVKQYTLDEKGVKVGEKMYRYGEFRSFSVVEEGAIDSIWLKPLKRFTPFVVMYFSPEDEQKIIDVLANFLPHEERELDAIDRLTKRMRF